MTSEASILAYLSVLDVTRKLKALVKLLVDDTAALTAHSDSLVDQHTATRTIEIVFGLVFDSPLSREPQSCSRNLLHLRDHPMLMELGPFVVRYDNQALEPLVLLGDFLLHPDVLLRSVDDFLSRPLTRQIPQ